jgi:chromosome partitioning protein
MVITFLNLKGGCGKTTLSIHVASTLALAGKKVMLIDADEQMSSVHWAETRDKDPIFTVTGIPSNTIHKQIKLMQNDYDFIIVDGPPRTSSVSRSCVVASDLVLIPVTPSPYDVWAASEIIEILDNVKHSIAEYKKINAAIIINRKIHNTNLGKEVEVALKEYNIPIFDTIIHQRIAYAESAAAGTSVIEEDPSSIAGQEIKNLVEEIIIFTGLKQSNKVIA